MFTEVMKDLGSSVVRFDEKPSIICNIMQELRDKDIQKDSYRFRGNANRLGTILAYEVSKDLGYVRKQVQTPLGVNNQVVLAESPVLVNVLRAANSFVYGMLEVFRESKVGYIAAARDESTLKANVSYVSAPNLEGRTVIIADPMLATGGSCLKTIEILKKYGNPKQLIIQSVIAAEQGIEKVASEFSDIKIYVGAIDPRLTEEGFIDPGLGDFGDLGSGKKYVPKNGSLIVE